MTKQEIENLNVGDQIIRRTGEKHIVIEIKNSKYFKKIILTNRIEDVNMDEGFIAIRKYDEIIESFSLFKQPKKIPYTAETFPENAILVRQKHYAKGVRYLITCVTRTNIDFFDTNAYFEDMSEDLEIGCLTRNHKIEWRPFYIEE